MFALHCARRTHRSLRHGADQGASQRDRSSAWKRTLRCALWVSPCLLGRWIGTATGWIGNRRRLLCRDRSLNLLATRGQPPGVWLAAGVTPTRVLDQAEALEAR